MTHGRTRDSESEHAVSWGWDGRAYLAIFIEAIGKFYD